MTGGNRREERTAEWWGFRESKPAPVVEPSQGAERAALARSVIASVRAALSLGESSESACRLTELAFGVDEPSYDVGKAAGYAAAKAEQATPGELGHVATVRRIAALVHEDGRPELAGRILVSEGTFALRLNTPEFDEPLSPTTEELVATVRSCLELDDNVEPDARAIDALSELARRVKA